MLELGAPRARRARQAIVVLEMGTPRAHRARQAIVVLEMGAPRAPMRTISHRLSTYPLPPYPKQEESGGFKRHTLLKYQSSDYAAILFGSDVAVVKFHRVYEYH